MRKLSEILIIITMVMIGCTDASKQSSTKVEIKNNWYYINGEKFFIKGIGYEIGARPGQDPYGDSIFMKESVDLVNMVVAYTKKYDCVISYLILNEPMTNHVYQCGAQHT